MKLLLGSLLTAGAAALSLRAMDLAQFQDADGHQNVKGLEDTLLGLLKEGSTNTPALQQFISQIRRMLERDMKPQVLKHKEEEQQRLNAAAGAFGSCSSTLRKEKAATDLAVSGAKSLQDQLNKATAELADLVSAEKSCLSTLKAYSDLRDSTCGMLRTLTQQGNPCSCSVSAGNYISELSVISKCVTDQLQKVQDADAKCKDAAGRVASQKPTCDARTAAVNAKKAAVETLKVQAERASCDAFTKGKQSCDAGTSCYAKALTDFNAVVKAAKAQEEGMKSEWEGLSRMGCLADVFDVDDMERSQAISRCKNRDVDTSALNLRYPKAPAADSCTVPTGVTCVAQAKPAPALVTPSGSSAQADLEIMFCAPNRNCKNWCWNSLSCPKGQAKWGDGSACRGGGLPECDLGFCTNNPNRGRPACPVDFINNNQWGYEEGAACKAQNGNCGSSGQSFAEIAACAGRKSCKSWCWLQLACPEGQTRYGDGSACRGGGLPTCDLGFCSNQPNGGMPSCPVKVVYQQ